MDTKRLFLYLTLALTIFLLWSAWEKDYSARAPQKQSTPAAERIAATQSSNGEYVPSAVSTDLKSAKQSVKQKASFHSSANSLPSHRLVLVKTDVLNIKIDTLGGNIVFTSFPKYPLTIKTPDIPYVLLNHQENTLYTAQSGFLGLTKNNKPIQFTTSAASYTLGQDQNELVVSLNAKLYSGAIVTKQYRFKRGDYLVHVNFLINNTSRNAVKGTIYTQLTRKWPIPSKSKGLLHAMTTFTGAAISTPDNLFSKYKFKALKKENINVVAQGGWVAMLQQYFLSAWIPNKTGHHRFYSHVSDNDLYSVGMLSAPVNVSPGEQVKKQARLYVGPELPSRLKAIAPGLDLTIDYGWFWFISILIFWLLKHIHEIVGNWGWSIILVTVFIKALFYKLSAMSYKSMANLRKLQPKLDALKKRYKDDKQQFSKVMMELYRKEKVNPLGGCLPIVVQIPVFIALYWVLIESVQLRQAPFMLWIHDLSQPDPFYVLPIIMGITMFIQQKLSPPPPDPTQAKIMMALPVVFTVLFLNFPAGLVLYWVVNNSLSILQQWYITRKIEKQSIRKRK